MEEEEAAVDGGACRRPPPVAKDFTPAAAGDLSRSASAPRCCRSRSPPPPPPPTRAPTPPLHRPRAPPLPPPLRDRHRLPPPHRLLPGPPSPFPCAFFLFPSIPAHLPAAHLADFAESARGKAVREKGLVLVVFDGTWSHAKEMVRVSRGFLGGFAVQVSPGFDASVDGGSIFDDELVLRKEPFGGCGSTVEAVARALRSVEPNGAEVEDRLLGVLRTMVRMQAGYQKPMKPRPRLEKKGKKKKREEEEEGNAGTSEC